MAEVDSNTKSLSVRYRNNAAYRSVHASGAYGGAVPTGEIFLGIFSERTHFPESALVEFDEVTHQAKETVQVEKGIVREMEVGIIMNLEVAKSIHLWLQEKINFVEGMMASSEPRVEVLGGKSKLT